MVRLAFENFCSGHSSKANESSGAGGMVCGSDGENPEMFRR